MAELLPPCPPCPPTTRPPETQPKAVLPRQKTAFEPIKSLVREAEPVQCKIAEAQTAMPRIEWL
jgi:hypothetical protein